MLNAERQNDERVSRLVGRKPCRGFLDGVQHATGLISSAFSGSKVRNGRCQFLAVVAETDSFARALSGNEGKGILRMRTRQDLSDYSRLDLAHVSGSVRSVLDNKDDTPGSALDSQRAEGSGRAFALYNELVPLKFSY